MKSLLLSIDDRQGKIIENEQAKFLLVMVSLKTEMKAFTF